MIRRMHRGVRWLGGLALAVAWAPGSAFGHGPEGRPAVWAQATDGLTELDEPMAMRLAFGEGAPRAVRVVAVGRSGLAYLDRDGDRVEARWVGLSPASLASTYPKLIDGSSVATWLELGGLLSTMQGAARQERVAFSRARQIDPQAATPEAIEAARAAARSPSDSEASRDGGGGQTNGRAGRGASAGPRITAVDRAWPELTEAEHAEATQALRDFAEPIVQRIAPGRWKTTETDYFLLYTDLDSEEARYWARQLDRMYDRMRNVFRVPDGTNVFQGRCLITIWSTRERFGRWVRLAEGYDIGARPGVAGLCTGYPDGRAHVTFFRQPDRNEFALILVHEASHAFTHRYRTGRRIPSWVNEGLAEYVAHNLIDAPQWAAGRARGSREAYQANGGLASMFVMPSIEWYQYGQAWEFTEMMVEENVDGYRAFFDALKDGEDVHTALEDHYGASLDRLVRHYHNVYNRSGRADYVKP
ncbi:MAG: hypothetical protein AAF586_05635 [Planctomycetota bacterium]